VQQGLMQGYGQV